MFTLDQCLSINEGANSTHITGSALRIKASNRMTMPVSLAGFTEQGSTVCSVLDGVRQGYFFVRCSSKQGPFGPVLTLDCTDTKWDPCFTLLPLLQFSSF